MSVIVKGLEMPENCISCYFQFGGFCGAAPPEVDERVAETPFKAIEQGKPEWCPLVKLPEKHGRLIDADRLIWVLEYNFGHTDGAQVMNQLIANSPTAIEAEGTE